MTDEEVVPDRQSDPIDAGRFSEWLEEMRAAQQGAEAEVPCGTCTACCTSSQFVLVRPDDVAARSVIPSDLLFVAPGMPSGHDLLGFDQDGNCPMLVDNACSIYDHRPRTCRDYDCRVFAATDTRPDETKVRIIERVDQWRFRHDDEADLQLHTAVRNASGFLELHAQTLTGVPSDPTARAVLAVAVHRAFLDSASPSIATVQQALDQHT